MSRSGYTDDCEHLGLWRGAVRRATTGHRGQAFLVKLLSALDAMPNKRLSTDAIKDPVSGDVCALGSIDPNVDAYDAEYLATHFGIARALAAEIVYENDESGQVLYARDVDGFLVRLPAETPEQRWVRMRAWVASQIVQGEAEP